MPLQVRRGTEAERLAMTQKLADGELLWITDDKKLYVGDGATSSPSLAPVTGFNTEDAQDAAASMITTATHSGINFTYDDLAGTLTASVDLSNYSGVIEADAFVGSVFADNSTLLVDGVLGRIVGPVFANVTGNVTGDLTGNVIGNLAGNVTGNVTGNLAGNVTGNVTGFVNGDIRGSVFGDDSSILVDAVSNLLRGNYQNSAVSITNATLISTEVSPNLQLNPIFNIGSPTEPVSLTFHSNGVNKDYVSFRGVCSDAGGSGIVFQASRGSTGASTVVSPGDTLALIRATGFDGTNFQSAGQIGIFADPDQPVTGGSVPGTFGALVVDGEGATQVMTFNSSGVLSAPVMKVGSFATVALPSGPSAGMIVYDSTTNQYKGYVAGTTNDWVVLG